MKTAQTVNTSYQPFTRHLELLADHISGFAAGYYQDPVKSLPAIPLFDLGFPLFGKFLSLGNLLCSHPFGNHFPILIRRL